MTRDDAIKKLSEPLYTDESIQQDIDKVMIDDKVLAYLVSLTNATRGNPDLVLPASPRASRALFRFSKAIAATQGRDFVIPDDIKQASPYVLTHRINLSSDARLTGKTPENFVSELLRDIPVPGNEEELLGLKTQ